MLKCLENKDEKLVFVRLDYVKKQPLLTNFPSTIFATAKRKTQAAFRATRNHLQQDSLSAYALLFDSILSSSFMQSIDATTRQRLYGHRTVFWAWLAQILEANASCTKAVSLIQSWNMARGLPIPSSSTASYCTARTKIPISFLQKVSRKIITSLDTKITEADRWYGFTLKAIDGSSVQLMDTEENQQVYPQSSVQTKGCGHPIMGIVGVVNLSHGGWQGLECCQNTEHDARVAPRLLRHIEQNDLLLADRAFCTYEFICRIRQKGAHVVMRLHQARHRKLDWRKGKKVSPIERLVTWKKPVAQPVGSNLTKLQWEQLPAEMTMRYIKLGYENRSGEKRMLVVITDLLDNEKHDALEIADLYMRRWDIEVKLRDIKTTLGMEFFAVKTPEMAHRTLWMLMIASNLVRALMQQAAQLKTSCAVHQLSFKSTVDMITSIVESFRPLAGKVRKLKEYYKTLLEVISTKTLNIRPFRREPRAIKRRPKNYNLLTKPRHVFQETPHRSAYRALA